MKIALGQVSGTPGSKQANLALLAQTAAEAVHRGADLLVMPELFLTGYNIGEALHRLAEPSDGPSAVAAAAIAREAGVALIYGYPEKAGTAFYNALAVIDHTGALSANYRKIHLWGADEERLFVPGYRLTACDLCGHRFGLQICYDVDFADMTQAFARQGVEGIIAISATTAPYTVVPRHVVPARAYENKVFFAFCNRAGQESGLRYAGESVVAAPDGSILAAADGAGDELVIAEIDPPDFIDYRREHLPAVDPLSVSDG